MKLEQNIDKLTAELKQKFFIGQICAFAIESKRMQVSPSDDGPQMLLINYIYTGETQDGKRWIPCDGRLIRVSEYPQLVELINPGGEDAFVPRRLFGSLF